MIIKWITGQVDCVSRRIGELHRENRAFYLNWTVWRGWSDIVVREHCSRRDRRSPDRCMFSSWNERAVANLDRILLWLALLLGLVEVVRREDDSLDRFVCIHSNVAEDFFDEGCRDSQRLVVWCLQPLDVDILDRSVGRSLHSLVQYVCNDWIDLRLFGNGNVWYLADVHSLCRTFEKSIAFVGVCRWISRILVRESDDVDGRNACAGGHHRWWRAYWMSFFEVLLSCSVKRE